jgi:hypothetical protein
VAEPIVPEEPVDESDSGMDEMETDEVEGEGEVTSEPSNPDEQQAKVEFAENPGSEARSDDGE